MHIFSWTEKSETAKLLAQTLDIKRIKHENSKFRGSPGKTVINYGSSNLPEEVLKCRVINRPERVAVCTNKLQFFRTVSQGDDSPRVPDWTVQKEEAADWILQGSAVVARTVLQGHSGEGIVIMDSTNPQDYVDAPLYTKYVKKKNEYRVHVMNDEIIDFARKALRSDFDGPVNTRVRNYANGYIFARENVTLPDDVKTQSILAIKKVGLDYGAVDVIFNENQGRAYVLEINTAPGMEGTTLTRYSEAFKKHFG